MEVFAFDGFVEQAAAAAGLFGNINFISGDATVEVDFVGELVADFEGGGLFDGGLELDFEVVFVEGLVVMFGEAGVGCF